MSDMEQQPGSERVSVSLSTLRAELSGLELRLVDRLNGALVNKADRAIQDQHAQRIADMTARLQALEQAAVKVDSPLAIKVEAHEQEIISLRAVAGYKKWLWAQTLALVGIVIAIVGVNWNQGF